MKKRPFTFTLLLVALLSLTMVAWRLNRSKNSSPSRVFTAVAVNSAERPQPPEPASASKDIQAEMNSPQGQARIKQAQQLWAAENDKAQDFYGKVVDQSGNPVAGATAFGTLLWIQGFDVGEKRQQHTAMTDEEGRFQFTGLRAARLAVAVRKDGYIMDQGGHAYQAPNAENKTTAEARAIFTMWKLKGAEPMLHLDVNARVPYDGRTVALDPLTGKMDPEGGFRITLTRDPLNIRRGIDQFNWRVHLEATNGGLIEASAPYPFLAPEAGYQSSLVYEQTKDSTQWTERLTKTFYLHLSDRTYGRILVDLFAGSTRSDAGVHFEIWINPSGSRNLEYDSRLQIKSRP